MKTIMLFISSIVMMVIMYVYFLAICLYALVAFPFIKLNKLFIKSFPKINQLAGV